MKYSFSVEVDCAACAARMERAIGHLPSIQGATVDFLMQRLIVETEEERDVEELMKLLRRECRRIERDFEIGQE